MIEYFCGVLVGGVLGWILCRIKYDIWKDKDLMLKKRQISILKNEISRLLDKQEKLLRWKPTQRS